jgi:hypothetical protein
MDATTTAAAAEPLSGVHESVVAGVLAHLDTRSKLTLMSTCRGLRDLCSRPEVWTRVAFDDASQQHNLSALQLVGVLKLARGRVEELRLARCVCLLSVVLFVLFVCLGGAVLQAPARPLKTHTHKKIARATRARPRSRRALPAACAATRRCRSRRACAPPRSPRSCRAWRA